MAEVDEIYADDLRFLVMELLRERGETPDALVAASTNTAAGHPATASAPVLAAASATDLWVWFRALVNTRVPGPAPEDFIRVQDRVLHGLIAEKGIVDVGSLPTCASDGRLTVWRGDITTLRADAIVNAANSQMLGCWRPGHSCIDNAIHTFSGVQLRAECAALMRAQGHDEPAGQAKATSAYNLPAKHIIHTVGPIVSGCPSARDEKMLASCYASCLDAAAELGCHTVAFCCIGTGVYGFPQERAARIAVATVRNWLDVHGEAGDACEHGGIAEGCEAYVDPTHGGHDGIARVVFDVFLENDEEIYHELLG